MTSLSLTSSLPRYPLFPRLQSFRTNRNRRIMNSMGATPVEGEFDQNVIVMRHGDRMDNFDPLWVKTAERPWDPPLVHAGHVRAFSTGRRLRLNPLGFPIHRVFVSPFFRCIQTASEVVTAICAADDDENPNKVASDCVEIDPSRSNLKVSIEYGLCEMLNREAIRQESVPKDGIFHFTTSDLEPLVPAGTLDHTAEHIYTELPRWEETIQSARARYEQVIKTIADRYPTENLLLVTHGEGVGTSVSTFLKGAEVYEVNYCAYSHAKRKVVLKEDKTHEAGSFELVTVPGETGIKFYTGSLMSDGL